jgi:hypothetical protein
MAQDRETRTGSMREFFRDYAPYIVPVLMFVFFATKDRLVGNLPQLSQAQAKCEMLIGEQQKEITRLDKETALQKQEQVNVLDKLQVIDRKLDMMDRYIRRSDR